jgi:hypothetical protein
MNTEQQQNLSMLIVLRLIEMSPEMIAGVIQAYTQLCDIEERHVSRMLALNTRSPPASPPIHALFENQHWA